MLTENDEKVADWMRVMDKKNWPKYVDVQITCGETEMQNLTAKFKLNERKLLIDFREYLYCGTLHDSLLVCKMQ